MSELKDVLRAGNPWFWVKYGARRAPGFGFTRFIQDSNKSGMTAFDMHDAYRVSWS